MQRTENIKEEFETLGLWPRDPTCGGIGEDVPGNTNKHSLTKTGIDPQMFHHNFVEVGKFHVLCTRIVWPPKEEKCIICSLLYF